MLLTSVTDQAETPTAGRLTSPHVNTRPTERHFPKGAPGTRPGRLAKIKSFLVRRLRETASREALPALLHAHSLS